MAVLGSVATREQYNQSILSLDDHAAGISALRQVPSNLENGPPDDD